MEMAPIVFVVILVHPQTVPRRGDLIEKGPALQKGDSDVACSENSKRNTVRVEYRFYDREW